MNPAAMVKNPPVQSSPERSVYQRPEWSRPAGILAYRREPYDEPDLDLWLHDSWMQKPQWVVLLCAITCRATLLPPWRFSRPATCTERPGNLPRESEDSPGDSDYQDEHGVKPRKFLYRQVKFPCGRTLSIAMRITRRWPPVTF